MTGIVYHVIVQLLYPQFAKICRMKTFQEKSNGVLIIIANYNKYWIGYLAVFAHLPTLTMKVKSVRAGE